MAVNGRGYKSFTFDLTPLRYNNPIDQLFVS